MIETFRIGVAIGMQNNVSSVLKIIQRDLLGLNHAVDLTQGKFNSMKLAAVGAAAAFAGFGMLDAFKGLVDAGGAVLNAQARMLQVGISMRDVAQETAVAYQNVGVAGTTAAGNINDLLELRSILGDFKGANLALSGLEQAKFALTGAGIDPSQIEDFIKPLDVMGAFKTGGALDPSKFGPALQMAVSAILTSGGLLTGAAFQRAIQLSGPVAAQMGEAKFLQTMLEPLLALGTKAARGLQYGGTTFLGGQMSKATAARLDMLGLTTASDYTHEGGRWTLDPNKIAGASVLNSGDLVGWIQDYFLPAAQRAGLNPLVAASSLPQTLQALITSVYELGPQIAKSIVQQAQANTANPYQAAMTSLAGAADNFTTAMTGLWQALGTPAAQIALPWINRFADAIRSLTAWLGTHPAMAKAIDETLLGLGAALAVLGTAAVAGAVVSMVGAGGTIALVAGGLAALGGAMWALDGALTTIFHDIEIGLDGLERHLPGWAKPGAGGSVPTLQPGAARDPPALGSGAAYQAAAQADATMVPLGTPGNPVHVTVTNPSQIGAAAAIGTINRINNGMTAPPGGPTAWNPQAGAPGSAATGGGH